MVESHRWVVLLVGLLSLAACDVTDPKDASRELVPLPGVLAVGGLEAALPSLPQNVRLGETLVVPIQTFLPLPPPGPCGDAERARILEGPGDTEVETRAVSEEESVLEIRPRDRLVPRQIPPELQSGFCVPNSLIPMAHREIAVTPVRVGILTLRVVGRELRPGDRLDSPGRVRILEFTVHVEPSGPAG